uniref:Uncharacterized protein n=1 Tax=Arundo donax TaxID=35708 RepID=A0A0A9FC18_ARUDO
MEEPIDRLAFLHVMAHHGKTSYIYIKPNQIKVRDYLTRTT